MCVTVDEDEDGNDIGVNKGWWFVGDLESFVEMTEVQKKGGTESCTMVTLKHDFILRTLLFISPVQRRFFQARELKDFFSCFVMRCS